MSSTIVCLGDSLTNGVITNGYPTVLQDLLNQRQPGQYVVKKYGIHGATVGDWLSTHLASQQYKQCISGGCDAIVLLLGTNDAQKGAWVNEHQFCDKMQQLVNRLKNDAPGASIFLATPTPVTSADTSLAYASKCYDPQILYTVFPRIFPQIAASLGATCIDCCSPLGGPNANQRMFSSDGVHLSNEGDKIVASTVCDHVMRISGRARNPYIPDFPMNPGVSERNAMPHSSRIPGGTAAFQSQGMQSLRAPSYSMLQHFPNMAEVPQVQKITPRSSALQQLACPAGTIRAGSFYAALVR
jgi:lysophospholipase L1-like esterase